VRIGGDIKAPMKTHDVKPAYPPIAQDAQVQGVVILEILVDTNGKVVDRRILRSIPLLDQAALEAVSQWEYTPTLLNGNPVSVLMTVTVHFSLQ
jgi:protein TonB